LTIVRPAGQQQVIDSTMTGSSLRWAWRTYRATYPYAYDALSGTMYTTDTSCTRLSKITGVTNNFSAYPSCGLHTDGYFYIRKTTEYSNGNIIVRAVKDDIMGVYGLQYSTDGSTWMDSNIINR
jgi:hypothetical protein